MDDSTGDDGYTDGVKQATGQAEKKHSSLDGQCNSDLKDKFSDIKIAFLPRNTSRLQPLDAGIIKIFKVHYWWLLLKHTLAQIDGTNLTASSIVKTVNVLTAIRWIKKAWNAVQPQTIINCFRKQEQFHKMRRL